MYHNLYYYILKEREKLIMSININDIVYNYEDEELDDIEYLEIMNYKEFSRKDDINNNLFELFSNKNNIGDISKYFGNIINDNDYKHGKTKDYVELYEYRKKANQITDLIFNIIKNTDDNNGNLLDYDNYIFNADVEKIFTSEKIINKTDVQNFNNLKKKTVSNHDIAKNKYFFAIKYNNDSTKVRLKPLSKINITIEPNDKFFPIYYPIFPSDDVNIPIISVNYKIPKVITNDYIYNQITSHLIKSKNINFVSSENYENIRDLVKNVKPDIYNILEYLKKNINYDYYDIEIALNKFGKTLDLINKEDFDALYDYLTKAIGNLKERKNITRPVKIKKPDIINKKLLFFEKLSSTIQLLNLTENIIEFLDKSKMILDNERENNIIIQEEKGWKDLNIYKILQDIKNTGIYDNEAVIVQKLDFIKHFLKNENILEAIQTIDNILKTNEKKELIVKKYEKVKGENEYSRNHIFDYDKDGKQYIISYREIKEIKDSHTDGIPINAEGTVYESRQENDDDTINNENDDINMLDYNKLDIEKYKKNNIYNIELGFIDALENLLNIMYDITKFACIDFDYDALCIELFKYNRSIYKRRDLYKKYFEDNDIEVSEEIMNSLDIIAPKFIYDLVKSKSVPFADIDDNQETIINECNKIWIEEFNDMFLNALAYCIINIQEKILNNTIPITVDLLNGNFISYWDNCGTPIHKKEKRGVMTYLIEVVKEYFQGKINNNFNEYKINTDNLFDRTYKKIEEYYSVNLENIKKNDEICREKKKELKGKIEREKLVKLCKNDKNENKLEQCKRQYVLSLLYMPDVNYVKIHRFLNGCCLKQLNDTFSDNIDFENSNRTDLIFFKEKYAKIRMTNKPRDLRFIPNKDKNELFNEDEDIIDRIIFDDMYNIDNNSKLVAIWLNKMKDKNNSIFQIDIIEDFENNNIKSIKSNITFNINLLTKTSKHIGDDFIDNFNNVKKNSKGKKDSNDKINYLNIIRAIMKVLYGNLRNKDNSEYINILLNNSINDLRAIIIDLKELNNIYNDEIENKIDIINKYIVSRALCSPFNTYDTLNGKIISNVIDHQLIYKITNDIYKSVLEIIKISFPTMEENIEFLNKQREENKQGKIKILNDKTIEDIKLLKELKKAGVNKAIIQEKINEVDEVNDIETADDIYNNDAIFDNGKNKEDNYNVLNDIMTNEVKNGLGEDNDILMTYDRDDDDEYMENEDKGFIYN